MRELTPTIHLICGSTGAGKTTYSARLSEQTGAVSFSIDDWMVTLFGPARFCLDSINRDV